MSEALLSLSPKRVLLLVAMAHEAAPLIALLGLQPIPPTSVSPPPIAEPMLAYSGRLAASELVLVINGARVVRDFSGRPRARDDGTHISVEGVSVVPAAVTAWEAARLYKPTLVINSGTCGGVRLLGARRGQVYVARSPVVYYDRHVDFRLPGDAFEPNNYMCYGRGSFPLASLSPQVLPSVERLGVATGASFGGLFGKNNDAFQSSGAALVEMEAAAIAEVCAMLLLPLLLVKGVTDYIDGQATGANGDEFREHLAPVSETIASTVRDLIQALQ